MGVGEGVDARPGGGPGPAPSAQAGSLDALSPTEPTAAAAFAVLVAALELPAVGERVEVSAHPGRGQPQPGGQVGRGHRAELGDGGQHAVARADVGRAALVGASVEIHNTIVT